MRDLMAELKELRLHGMATAWAELTAQGESNTASSKWLLEHLLEQEHTDRAMRSVSHQMNMAKLPMHRDLASFDFNASSADARLISELASLAFTDTAQNVVLIGGPGTGKTHLATALAVSGITRHGKRVRFYSTVDLVNLLERENTTAKPGGSPRHCCAWIWSSSTNWVICRSARLAVRCCFTCCPSCTNTPAW